MGLNGSKRMDVNKVLWPILFLYVFFFSMTAVAGEIYTLRLRQAYPQGEEIKVYFDILDENEEPVQGLSQDKLGLTVNLGQNPVPIKSFQPFAKADEGVAYVFLVDVSKSLSENEFQQIKKAMGIWIDSMTEEDRASVVTFGESVRVAQDFTTDQTVLKKTVDMLYPKDQKTQLHRGLARAIELGRRIDPLLPARRVIITLSDGRQDYTGGMVKDEVLDMMHEDRIPIYAMGFYRPPLTAEKQKYLDVLGEFARRSGGDYWQMNSTPIPETYSMIRRRILQSYVVSVGYNKQVLDGNIYHLRFNLTQGGKVLSDGINTRLLPVSGSLAHTQTAGSNKNWIFFGVIGIVMIGSLAVVFFKSKFSPEEYPVEEVINEDDFLAEMEKTNLPGIKLRINVTGKNDNDHTFEVKLVDRITIGRDKAGNGLPLSDNEISRIHCELTRDEDLVFIRDLGSRNGTFVNGIPIKGRHRLESGDLILIGRTELRMTFDGNIIT